MVTVRLKEISTPIYTKPTGVTLNTSNTSISMHHKKDTMTCHLADLASIAYFKKTRVTVIGKYRIRS